MRITKYIIGLGMMAGTVLGLPLSSVLLNTCTAVSGYVMRMKNYRRTS